MGQWGVWEVCRRAQAVRQRAEQGVPPPTPKGAPSPQSPLPWGSGGPESPMSDCVRVASRRELPGGLPAGWSNVETLQTARLGVWEV